MEKVKIHIEKRIFDIVFSLLAIILFSSFVILLLIAMLLESIFAPSSRGSFFYTETRISEGEPFIMYKFRIFKKSVLEKELKEKKFIHTKPLEQDKNNLTYIGRFLKSVYMDESAQLYNVLRGDMSLVGPRPTNTENSKQLYKDGKYSRFLIRAGITGYFQSQKGSEKKLEQEAVDMEYVNFCRGNPGWKVVLLDLRIIYMTIKTVFRAEGV